MKKIIITLLSLLLFVTAVTSAVAALKTSDPYIPMPNNQRDKFQTDLFTGAATYSYPIKVPKGTNDLTPNIGLSYNNMGVRDNISSPGIGWQVNRDFIERDVNFTPGDTSDDKFKLHFQGGAYDLIYNSTDNTYHTKTETFAKIEKLDSGVTPTLAPAPAPVLITNFTGEYYSNQSLSGSPVFTRTDSAVNFDWGDGSPGGGIPTDFFSARWTTTTNFPSGGAYQFTLIADDGSRLFIDGKLVIDRWVNSGPALSYIANLAPGDHQFVIEYYESAGGASINFTYQPVDSPAPTDSSEYWRVTTTDGTKYTFGNTESSEVLCDTRPYTLDWSLNEVQDTHNNHMYYTYFKSNLIDYLSKIEYNNDKSRSVTFSYTPSSYRRSALVQGCNTHDGFQLSSITTKAAGNQVNAYALSYAPSAGGQPLLSSITEKGSDGTSLPPTTFDYKPQVKSFNSTYTDWEFQKPMDADIRDASVRLVDVNGDGLPDIVKGKSGLWQVHINTGSTWDVGWQTWASGLSVSLDDKRTNDSNNLYNGRSEVTLMDVTGDGLPDIVESPSTDRWYVWRNTGTGWNSTPETWVGTVIDSAIYMTTVVLADVNGDGLPDIVKSINNGGPNNSWRVYMNTGSNWQTTPQDWGDNISVNLDDGNPWIIDVNGDGLPDIVRTDALGGPNASWYVYINTGTSWNSTPETWIWNAPVEANLNNSTNVTIADTNGDGLPDIVQSINHGGPNNEWRVLLNTGHSWLTTWETWVNNASVDANLDQTDMKMVDANGDGLPDLLREYFDSCPTNNCSTWRIWTNNGFAPDTLAAIHTSQGGKISFDYMQSSLLNNKGTDAIADLPFNMWVVQKLTTDNGMVGPQNTNEATTYSYANGLYNWQDKEFRGFKNITENLPNGAKKQYIFNQDSALKGMLASVVTSDNSGNPYAKTEDFWTNTQNNGAYTVLLRSEKNYIYDGVTANPKVKETDYQYDSYGNLTKKSELGDPVKTGDEKFTHTEYTYNPALWLVNKPKHTYVNSFDDTTKVLESWFYYDLHTGLDDGPVKGDLTQEVKWLQGGQNPITNYAYDNFGNQTKVTDANNHSTQTIYGITDTTNTYPEKVINAKNQATLANYDLGTGNVLSKTDPNGNTTSYTYDVFGRITKEVKPYDTTDFPTTSYQYFNDGVAPEGTLVSKREVSGQAGTLDNYTFVDGLGRTIQTRSDAEDPSQQIVSDTYYNNLGLVAKQSVPHLDTYSAFYTSPLLDAKVTTNQYDILGRQTSVINPNNTTQTTSYDHLTKTTTNENGHSTKQYLNAFNQIYQVDEIDGGLSFSTFYMYDPLNNLTQIFDAAANSTYFTYDTLGRKTMQNDPDLGVWHYEYDGVGNLKKQIDNRNITTTRSYDQLDRVTKIDYPTDTDVTSAYDAPTVGTLSQVTDAAGTINYSYDNRLRKTQEERTIDGNTWTTHFAYDSADRMTSRTNPDGEVVNYTFNPQGEIGSVAGLVSNIDYNAQNKITNKTFANGLTTNYTYNTDDFRLNRIHTGGLQDLSYTYDNGGNVASITDALTAKTQTFAYDSFERLINASETGGYNYSYQYNAIGNLVEFVNNGLSISYTYGGENAGVHALVASTDPVTVTPTPAPTTDPRFGTRTDGDISVANAQTVYTDETRSAVVSTANSGQATITISDTTGFNTGQEVFISQMQGAGAGNYEFGTIASITGNTLTLNQNLTNTFLVGGNNKAQVLRVMQYNNVIIQTGGILTAHAWDGNTGGIVVFRAQSLNISGNLTVSSNGYRGYGVAPFLEPGVNGEGTDSPGDVHSSSKNGNGGGGAMSGNQGGAGGGGNGTAGANGAGPTYGQGGDAKGTIDLTNAVLGGGGGSSDDVSSGGAYGDGGNGGGIIFVNAANLTVNSGASVTAKGANGGHPISGDHGGAGGGAGGSIFFRSQTAVLGTNQIIANGGTGGTGVGSGQTGGNGGDGRIRVEYGSLTGTTTPAASLYQDPTLGVAPTPTPTPIPTPTPTQINVALASNGGTPSASSVMSGYPTSSAVDGDRTGLGWGNNTGGWNDNSRDVYPDWLQVDFNGSKTIDEIDVFTLQDNFTNPVEPTDTMTFTLYGITNFDVQYWDGVNWTTIPNGSVTNNNKVWSKFVFSPLTTTKIRVMVNAALDGYSRIVELEAWGTSSSPTPAPAPDFQFGNGSDGNLTISSDTTEIPIDSSVSANAGSNTATVGSGLGFAANQIVMFQQTQGTNAGVWELAQVQSYAETTLNLLNPLTHSYSSSSGNHAQVRVVPQYQDFTVNAGKTYTAKAWNGTTGGILAFLANGTVTINGTINASEKGFRGGTSVNSSSGQVQGQGEGAVGAGGAQSTSANGNGGGGGQNETRAGDNNQTGGGGGGNGTVGATGDYNPSQNPGTTRGAGGGIAGTADLTTMVLGGGGGAGSYFYNTTGYTGDGGKGGGIIMLAGNAINITGNVYANGGNSLNPASSNASGAGGGGSILLRSQNATLGSGIITANGGTGSTNIYASNTGAGGDGRVRVEYGSSLSGTTIPTASAYQDPSLLITPTPTPTPTPTYTISGNVFVDTNSNGSKNTSETGYSGATVELSGATSSSITTDASGNYSFTGLPSGLYFITLNTPVNYDITTYNPVSISLPGTSTVNFGIFQPNNPPSIAAIPAASINEGDTYSYAGSFTDADSSSWTATVDYGDGSTVENLAINADRTFSLSHLYKDQGQYTVLVSITDNQGATASKTTTVTVGNIAPTVGAITIPSFVEPNVLTTASVSFTDPGTLDTHTATINWGDGSQATSGVVTETNGSGSVTGEYSYTTPGMYTVTITVFDNNNDSGQSTSMVIVNAPPVANAGGPYTMNEGDTIILNGTATDADNDTLTYSWDLNNDGIYDVTGQSTPFSANDGPSSQTATFKACDTHGGCATSQATISVNNVAPTVSTITVPTGIIALNTQVNVSGEFTDPGTFDTHTAVWDFGDGTSSVQGTVNEESKTVSGSHSYATSGSHTITLTITDNDGDSGSKTSQIVVNTPPTANANGPYSVSEGSTVLLSGTATDADGDTLTYSWDLNNDGIYDTTGASTVYSAADGPNIKQAVFMACDTHSACISSTATINIANVAPTVSSLTISPSSLQQGEVASATTNFTDPGTIDTHTANIDWGDGSAAQNGVVTESNGSGSVSGTHTYSTYGNYTITVAVTDKDGEIGTKTAQVFVNASPIANAGGPYDVNEGSSITLNGTGTDPNGDILSFAWDLDNNGTYEKPGQSVPFLGVDGPATKTVKLQVCDTHGACTISSTTVSVTNIVPTVGVISLAPSTLEVGQTASVAASFTDPGIIDTHTANINWGDGSAVQNGTVSESSGSGNVTGTHIYTTSGTHIVTVTVTDKDSGVGMNTTQIIANAPPAAALSLSPTFGTAPVSVTASATGSTNGTNPISTYTFNFGDGATVGPQTGATASHTYTIAGTYTITVTVRDTIGLTATTSQAIVISPVLTFSNILPSNLTQTTATINWTTNAPGTSQVKYGTVSGSYTLSSSLNATLSTSHSVGLTSLNKNKTYYYKVYSKNSAGVEYSSSEQTFKTPNR